MSPAYAGAAGVILEALGVASLITLGLAALCWLMGLMLGLVAWVLGRAPPRR